MAAGSTGAEREVDRDRGEYHDAHVGRYTEVWVPVEQRRGDRDDGRECHEWQHGQAASANADQTDEREEQQEVVEDEADRRRPFAATFQVVEVSRLGAG